MNATAPLALLGGTFDPVHLGHLRAAWEVADALDAELRLVPAQLPPHRPQPVASATARVAMLRAALAGQQRLRLDLREIDRAGPSYTVDTLLSLRAEIGSQRPLVLVLGQDAFAGLATWHRYCELPELAHILVMTRPQAEPGWPAALASWQTRAVPDLVALRTRPAGAIAQLQVSALAISASQIRALLAAGREPRYLLPDALCADPALLAAYRERG